MLRVTAPFLLRRFRWCFALLAVVGISVESSLTNRAVAQVVPDRTLGTESSQVLVDSIVINGQAADLIQSGAQRGDNLFHSFEDFSVDDGQLVYFDNVANVQRIISRVTGDSASNIFGTLGSLSDADIFLLNPNGIVFGPNATIDINGSLIASTAESIQFDDDLVFSTVEPLTPLLSVNVPLGLQYGVDASAIEIQGAALQANSGDLLALLGGNVIFDGGQVTAESGLVEIGGLTSAATLALSSNEEGELSGIGFPEGAPRGDVTLSNGAQVTVTSSNGGSIAVNARNLDIFERGALNAGISTGTGQTATSERAIAGDITVNATEDINLRDSSIIQNIVNADAVGDAGRIRLQADSLNLLTGSQIFTSTFGQGNAGQVNVNTQDTIVIDSESATTSTSGIISSVADGAAGNGGDIQLVTGSLSVTSGAQLNAITSGLGNAGNIDIEARDAILFDGSNVGASGILNAVAPTGRGNGGNVEITASNLSVLNGAQLNTITRGNGNAGNVTIDSREAVSIDGENANSIAEPFSGVSAIFTSVGIDDSGNQAIGDGGNISIQTSVLSITNGAELNAITRGQGNAGNVRILARDRVLIDGERQLSSTRAASGIYTSVDNNAYSGFDSLMPARGNGGDIDITTGSLAVTNGASISGLTGGIGEAGDVRVNAQAQVLLDGENSNGGASGIFSSVADNLYTGQPPGEGAGGDVDITTSTLSITQGAGIFANTRGLGDAGNVKVTARDRVSIDGENSNGGASGIFSSVGDEIDFPPAVGEGSDINIVADLLSITNGGGIFTNSSAIGNSGDISINTREVLLDGTKLNSSPSGLYVSVAPNGIGEGGDITLTSELLTISDSAGIFASTAGQGDAGSTTVDVSDRLLLSDGSIRATSTSIGTGGDINIAARVLSLTDQSEILTQTLSTNGGKVALTIEDLLVLTNNSTISTEAGTAQAGGDGGNIGIDTRFIVSAPDSNSDIVADAFNGNGGNVNIVASDGLFGIAARDARTSQSDITASSQNGVSGEINIQDPEVDPIQGTTELPTAFVGPEVTRSCREALAQSGNEFVVSGRGGLPRSPLDPAMTALWQDTLPIGGEPQTDPWVSGESPAVADATIADSSASLPKREVMISSTHPFVEMQGWIRNENGQIMLVAADSRQAELSHLAGC